MFTASFSSRAAACPSDETGRYSIKHTLILHSPDSTYALTTDGKVLCAVEGTGSGDPGSVLVPDTVIGRNPSGVSLEIDGASISARDHTPGGKVSSKPPRTGSPPEGDFPPCASVFPDLQSGSYLAVSLNPALLAGLVSITDPANGSAVTFFIPLPDSLRAPPLTCATKGTIPFVADKGLGCLMGCYSPHTPKGLPPQSVHSATDYRDALSRLLKVVK